MPVSLYRLYEVELLSIEDCLYYRTHGDSKSSEHKALHKITSNVDRHGGGKAPSAELPVPFPCTPEMDATSVRSWQQAILSASTQGLHVIRSHSHLRLRACGRRPAMTNAI